MSRKNFETPAEAPMSKSGMYTLVERVWVSNSDRINGTNPIHTHTFDLRLTRKEAFRQATFDNASFDAAGLPRQTNLLGVN